MSHDPRNAICVLPRQTPSDADRVEVVKRLLDRLNASVGAAEAGLIESGGQLREISAADVLVVTGQQLLEMAAANHDPGYVEPLESDVRAGVLYGENGTAKEGSYVCSTGDPGDSSWLDL